jgi:AraC-like DNA-binding protein
MKKIFKVEFNNTRTPVSRIATNTRNIGLIRSLYQAADVGYEFNSPGYYHKRTDGSSYLLAYTKSGNAYLTYEEKEIFIRPNSLTFISLSNPNVIETLDSDWEIYFIHVIGSDIDDIYRNATKLSYYFEDFDGEKFIEYIENIYNCYTNCYDKYFISEQIYSLLLDVLKQTEKVSIPNVITRAIDYLNKYFATNISIDQMCQEFFVSKYHFIRKFEEELNCSPKQYLTSLRLQKAKSLLVHTDKPINEIAQLVGFKTEKNMNYAFKTFLDTSPKEFRNSLYSEV